MEQEKLLCVWGGGGQTNLFQGNKEQALSGTHQKVLTYKSVTSSKVSSDIEQATITTV